MSYNSLTPALYTLNTPLKAQHCNVPPTFSLDFLARPVIFALTSLSMTTNSDHSWAAAYWKPFSIDSSGERRFSPPLAVGQSLSGEYPWALCTICWDKGVEIMQKYTPDQRSNAWRHTRQTHPEYNIGETGTKFEGSQIAPVLSHLFTG